MSLESLDLASLLKEDQENIQAFRKGKITLAQLASKQNEISVKFSEYINSKGFPFKDEFGQDVYSAAIVLSLHSGLNTLKVIFELIKNANSTKVEPKDKAYIQDKLLVSEGKPQVYGTQFKEGNEGVLEFYPIEDPENLDKRRGDMGLETMIEYKERIRASRKSMAFK